MPKVINSENDAAIAAAVEQGVQEASQWVKDWLDKRSERKDDQGRPLFSSKTFTDLKANLDNLRVYVGNDNLSAIQDDLQKGKLSPSFGFPTDTRKEILNDPDFKNALSDWSASCTGAGVIPYVKEPAIVINKDALEAAMNAKTGFQLDKVLTGLICSAITTNTVHTQYMRVMKSSNENLFMMMHDTNEMNAHLNGMRQELGLEPLKYYTPEEIARFRKELGISSDPINQFLRSQPATNHITEKQPVNQSVKFMFENFTDKQISDLLNNVAFNQPQRNIDGLYLEHNTGSELAMDKTQQLFNQEKVRSNQSVQIDQKSNMDLGRSGRHMM